MNTLNQICINLMLVASVLGLILLFTKRLDKQLYPIVWAVTVSILEEYISKYFGIKYKNNLPVFYLINPIEYACFAWFFYISINYQPIKYLIKYSIIGMLGFTFGYFYFFMKSPVTDAAVMLNYLFIAKSLLLFFWSIAYLKNIFDEVSLHKKLNVLILIMVGGILFYFSFSALYHLSEIYLVHHALLQNIGIYDILKAENVARIYASKQLHNVRPLLFITNILLYLCIFVAFANDAFISKKPLKTSV